MEHPFGIDFGGTGIKGAPVDLERGDFVARPRPHRHPAPGHARRGGGGLPRHRRQLPRLEQPGRRHRARASCATAFVHSAANIDKSWIGKDADAIFTEALGREVHVVNDADAAGPRRGRSTAPRRGRRGLVLVITLGTGIGSAMIWDGELVPNSELGHLELDGAVAEVTTATSAREREGLSWEEWSRAPDDLLPPRRAALHPRPLRRRRRREQVVGEVRPPHRDRDRDHPRQPAEPRRHRRRRARAPSARRASRTDGRAQPSQDLPRRLPPRRAGSARRRPSPPR